MYDTVTETEKLIRPMSTMISDLILKITQLPKILFTNQKRESVMLADKLAEVLRSEFPYESEDYLKFAATKMLKGEWNVD